MSVYFTVGRLTDISKNFDAAILFVDGMGLSANGVLKVLNALDDSYERILQAQFPHPGQIVVAQGSSRNHKKRLGGFNHVIFAVEDPMITARQFTDETLSTALQAGYGRVALLLRQPGTAERDDREVIEQTIRGIHDFFERCAQLNIPADMDIWITLDPDWPHTDHLVTFAQHRLGHLLADL